MYTDSEAVTQWRSPSLPIEPGQTLEAERLRPVRPPGVESDFMTPFLQALGIGFFALLLAGYIVWYFEAVWHLACFVSFLCAGLWYVWVLRWQLHNMVVKESIFTGPTDNPQPLPQLPQPEAVMLEVKQTDERGRLQGIKRFGDLPPDLQDKLPTFAAGVLAGKGLSVSTWTGRGCLFTRQEYDALMYAFHDAGVVTWRNPQDVKQGRELTTRGKAALKEISQY